jgi:hypothetical protein
MGRMGIGIGRVEPLNSWYQRNSNLNIVTRATAAGGIPSRKVRSSSFMLVSRPEAGFGAKLGVDVKDGIFACSRSRK